MKHDPIRVEVMMFRPTQDINKFLSYLISVWVYPDAISLKDKDDHYTLKLVTCGLSDNERIIKQLMSSMFQMYWVKSNRGGKHVFKMMKNGSPYFKQIK